VGTDGLELLEWSASTCRVSCAMARARIGLLHLDADGVILDANEALWHLSGFAPGSLLGTRFTATIEDEDDRARSERFLARAVADPQVTILHTDRILRRGDGGLAEFRLTLAIVRDGAGAATSMLLLVFDRIAPHTYADWGTRSPERAAAQRIARTFDLTVRQEQYLVFLSSGYRIATIASELHLASGTVRNGMVGLAERLGVSGQAEIVALIRDEVRRMDLGNPGGGQPAVNVSPR
jgi:PAS domain S-box-containing protein